jgi:hypothetical protein
VVGVARWRLAKKSKIGWIESEVMDFVNQCLNYVTDGFHHVPPLETFQIKLKCIFDSLLEENQKHSITAEELASSNEILLSVSSTSLRCDIMLAIMSSFREKRKGNWADLIANYSISCCSEDNAIVMKRNLSLLSSNLLSIIEGAFSSSFSFSIIDLQLITNSVRLLQVLSTSLKIRVDSILQNLPTKLHLISRLLIHLYERYKIWTTIGDEKVSNKKGTNVRERNIACKRALYTILSYLQTITLVSLERSESFHTNSAELIQVLKSLNSIISYLQFTRNEENFSSNDDAFYYNHEKESNAGSTGSATVTGAGGVNASTGTAAKPSTKEPNKKRCQDLIPKPMECPKKEEKMTVVETVEADNL